MNLNLAKTKEKNLLKLEESRIEEKRIKSFELPEQTPEELAQTKAKLKELQKNVFG